MSIRSIGLEGMKGHAVHIEANVRTEKEQFVIIGLPDTSIKESKERVLSCLHALDYDVSMKKITVHLSPADVRKNGTGFDCAMLLAVLTQICDKPLRIDDQTCILASLSLDGQLLPFHGLIPCIQQAIVLGFKRIIVPPINLSFLRHEPQVEIVPIESTEQLIDYFSGQTQLLLRTTNYPSIISPHETVHDAASTTDFAFIRGHKEAKRALEIAAAGGHHILLSGPPGCGKSMLADAFHTIFPDITDTQMLEIFSLYHLAKEKRGLSSRPPYRSPHHSSSAISLIGGGTYPKPGEISLAHHGVLFLDELGEFSRKALDMLRQPIETSEVTISRVKQSVTYPASFTLIAATNPCPCGYFGSNERYCTCTPNQIRSYQLKASGPLLDRLDFILTLKSVGLTETSAQETSATIRKRTERARAMQSARYGERFLNSNVPTQTLLETCLLTEDQRQWIQTVCFQEKWSNRTQGKLIRMARTIADLAGEETISQIALEEAIQWKRIASELNKQESVTTDNA